MSHLSRLARHRERQELAKPVPTFANMQQRERPQQLGIEALVPSLMELGAGRTYEVQFATEPKPAVRVNARLGPLTIPLDFTPDEAEQFAIGVAVAVQKAKGEFVEPAAEGEAAEEDDLTYTVASEACADA